MAFPVLMSALLVLSHAAAPPSDPERCRAAVAEAQALLAAVEADPDSYEKVEETRTSLRRTIAEARCAVDLELPQSGSVPAQASRERPMQGAKGWRVGRLRRGLRAGQGWSFTEYGANGAPTGRMIRWHPGGGHHGPDPYWRVSSPEFGKSGFIPGGP